MEIAAGEARLALDAVGHSGSKKKLVPVPNSYHWKSLTKRNYQNQIGRNRCIILLISVIHKLRKISDSII